MAYLSAADPKGLSYKTRKVSVRINKQSPDFAEGVHVGESEMEVGSGDQGISVSGHRRWRACWRVGDGQGSAVCLELVDAAPDCVSGRRGYRNS